ncbi:MAG: TonB family protein, partial [Bacteroidota bacterium]
VSRNFRYPQEAYDNLDTGMVFIVFSVDGNGNITNLTTHTEGNPIPSLEDEAKRLFSSLPHMQPGETSGKPVETRFSMQMNFKLYGR